MSQKELLKALEEDAGRERDSILEKSREKAEDILKDVEKEKKRIKEDLLKDHRMSLIKESTKAINEAKSDVRRELLSLKEEMIKEVFSEVDKEIERLVKTPEYQAVLKKLFLEVLQEIDGEGSGGKILIHASKKDCDLLRGIKIPPSFPYKIEFKSSNLDMVQDGLLLTTEDERISIENTFNSRQKKARKFLLPSLGEILFAEKE